MNSSGSAFKPNGLVFRKGKIIYKKYINFFLMSESTINDAKIFRKSYTCKQKPCSL